MAIFFFFAGKCMLLLNAFTYKVMCLCLICLDSMQIWKPNHIYLGNMIISRSTKMQSIVDWKIMINFSSFLFFNPTNIIESKPWYCRDLLTSKTSYTGAWFNWAILYIGKHTAQGFQDPLSESTYLPLSFKTMSGKHISIVMSESFPKPQFHKIASPICNNTGENTTAAKNMQLCFIFIDEVKGYLKKKNISSRKEVKPLLHFSIFHNRKPSLGKHPETLLLKAVLALKYIMRTENTFSIDDRKAVATNITQ